MLFWVLILIGLRTRFGAPISRRRIFIFLIKKEVLNDEAMSQPLDAFISKKLKQMHMPAEKTWLHSCTGGNQEST